MKDAIKAGSGGVYVSIDVTPGSSQSEIEGYNEWRKRISVKVKSPPRGGKANAELVKIFKDILGKKVEIVKGQTSSQKILFVHGATVEEVMERLSV